MSVASGHTGTRTGRCVPVRDKMGSTCTCVGTPKEGAGIRGACLSGALYDRWPALGTRAVVDQGVQQRMRVTRLGHVRLGGGWHVGCIYVPWRGGGSGEGSSLWRE
eukprot:356555-Chlamydomonas_euryale.AAC.1